MSRPYVQVYDRKDRLIGRLVGLSLNVIDRRPDLRLDGGFGAISLKVAHCFQEISHMELMNSRLSKSEIIAALLRYPYPTKEYEMPDRCAIQFSWSCFVTSDDDLEDLFDHFQFEPV